MRLNFGNLYFLKDNKFKFRFLALTALLIPFNNCSSDLNLNAPVKSSSSQAAGTSSSSSSSGSSTSSSGSSASSSSSGASSSSSSSGSVGSTTGMPAGWLYTSGNKIYLSNGNGGGTAWIGRGLNVDDATFCNGTPVGPNSTQDLTNINTTAVKTWKANFLRQSLWMHESAGDQTWVSPAPTASGSTVPYQLQMTSAIQTTTNMAGTYVLVTLRSEKTMTIYDGNEAAYVPTAATDPVYVALVDSFANNGNVLFGIANEPGGNSGSQATIVAAMTHAVSVIRAEEDRLKAPHHIISVQGTGYTSNLSFYDSSPLPFDNIVYELHYYPAQNTNESAASYTFAHIPVIIGEYGFNPASNITPLATAFFTDIESKQISSLAWDFDPFNTCNPTLVNRTNSSTNITATSPWGTLVQGYLASPSSY